MSDAPLISSYFHHDITLLINTLSLLSLSQVLYFPLCILYSPPTFRLVQPHFIAHFFSIYNPSRPFVSPSSSSTFTAFSVLNVLTSSTRPIEFNSVFLLLSHHILFYPILFLVHPIVFYLMTRYSPSLMLHLPTYPPSLILSHPLPSKTYPRSQFPSSPPHLTPPRPTISHPMTGSSVFYRPKDKAVHADNAKLNFARGGGGDHLALLR